MSAKYTVFVKGHPKNDQQEDQRGTLGACPFSLAALLVLEENSLPYTIDFVDLNNKPDFLTKISPNGTVPVLKDGSSYTPDSEAIIDYVSQKTGPLLVTITNCPQPGIHLWKAFVDYLINPGDADTKAALEKELEAVDQAVGDRHPYVGGKSPCAWDVALAPRIYLARVGCKELCEWDFCEDHYLNVKSYLHRWTGRPSWRNSAAFDQDTIVHDLNELKKKKEKGEHEK